MSVMADSHVEWHLNSGARTGSRPCPYDACDPYQEDISDAEWEARFAPKPKPKAETGIRCGNCKKRHDCVASVRSCYSWNRVS